ncbi:MAG: amino acid ABC transporter permease [Chloroflexi bacterium]|nr:amino acid ABC transporter permease [Chloroflexota bacterium]
MGRFASGPKATYIPTDETPQTAQGRAIDRLSTLPWWLIILLLLGVFLVHQLSSNEPYVTAFNRVVNGIGTTLLVTGVGYTLAICFGLVAGLGRVSKNILIFNAATLYVQVIRGVPILVQMLYWSFVIVPLGATALNALGAWLAPVLGDASFLVKIQSRDIDFMWRVTFALAFAYGGFEAETFRAGIESIGKGQMEAARSLGMSYPQAMLYIILPQAIRRVLPPLGNDLISMLKDSSLVSALGVREMTQEARLLAAANFRYIETYSSLAFMYLSLTLILSLFVRGIENRWKQG